MSWSDVLLGKRRVIAVAICLAALSVVVAACGGGGSSTGSSSGGSTAESETGESSGGGEKTPVTIAFFEGSTEIPYYVEAGEGATAAGSEDGAAKVVANGPVNGSESTAVTQSAESLLQSTQPDGYATNPCLTTAWTTVYPNLVNEVPNGNVLAYNCQATNTADEETPEGATTFVGDSYIGQGRAAAESAIKAGGLTPSTTGTAVLGQCAAGVPVLEEQVNGAKESVEKLMPKAKVVVFTSAFGQGENTAAWTSEMSKYSDVVFAFGACDPDTASLLTLKDRGIGGEFVAAANSPTSPQVIQGIEEGKFASGTSGLPWVQGNVATHLLIDAARGEKLPEGWIDTGYGEITKENAPEYLAALNSPAAAEKLFRPMAEKILKNIEVKPLAQSFE
jgi:ABC-type sugar transport system substrate-binding protein